MILSENEISKQIVNCSLNIHKKLGPGLFESGYEHVLFYELTKLGLLVGRLKSIPLMWDGLKLDLGFKLDLLVQEKVIIEIKSIETVSPVHYKQLMTYLKLTGVKLGFLIIFNEALIKDGISRIVNNL